MTPLREKMRPPHSEDPAIKELERVNFDLRNLVAEGNRLLREIELKLNNEKARQKNSPPFTPDNLVEPLN